MDYLRKTTSHPSASTVYEEMRKRIPDISLGTVYRTLGILREDGAIQELPYEGHSHYDARTDNHYHIVCLSCGSVADADLDQIAEDLTARLQVPGFRVVSHRLELLGYCTDCLAARSS